MVRDHVSIGDAVIATDRHGVITFMNVVPEALTGWGAEAVGRSVDEVFRIVEDHAEADDSRRTPARSDSFAIAVPADSELLIKADGRISINDSASEIKDDRGANPGRGRRVSRHHRAAQARTATCA